MSLGSISKVRCVAGCLLMMLLCAVNARAGFFVRAESDTDRQWLTDSGLTIEREYKHFPWVLVSAPASGRGVELRAAAAARGLSTASNGRVKLADVPNDPYFSSQTQFFPVNDDADEHWIEGWALMNNASSAIVAIIDSGIDVTHPDLAGNLWINEAEANGEDGVDDDGNGFVDDVNGWNFVGGDNDLAEVISHGSFVSGLIGAVGDNGVGVSGGCWDVQLLPLKAFIESETDFDYLLGAMNYALDIPGVCVINASWGDIESGYGEGEVELLREAVETVTDAGILFVAAAGNDGMDTDVTSYYPACFNDVIAVASVDSTGAKSSFSNWGSAIDVTAMGSDAYSTRKDNAYGSSSGTSYTAPQVSALAALLFAKHTNATPARVRSWIVDASRDTDSWGSYALEGGLIDVFASLELSSQLAASHWTVFE